MTYPVGAKGEGVGENLHNMAQNAGVGIFQGVDALVHPVRTMEGIAASLIPQPVLDWSKNQGREGELRKKRDRGEELSKDEQEYLRKAEGFEGAQNPIQQVVEGMQRPGEFLPNAAGQALVFDAAGRLLGPGASALKETSKKFREGMAGTGPRVTKELSAKTAEENAKNATRTEKLNAKRAEVDTARAGKVEKSNDEALKAHDTAIAEADKKNLAEHVKHLAEKSQIERANQEAGAVPRADEATGEHLKARTEEMDVRTERAAHDSLKKAEEMFKPLRDKLGTFDADHEVINNAVAEAVKKVGVAHPATSLLKDLAASIKGETIGKDLNIPTEGETAYKNPNFSFADEQAFYSRLGREFSSGTLPGDIYNAYKVLQDKIGKDMQRIADAQGKGKELAAARDYWKRQRQAFGKSSDANTSRAEKEIAEDNPDYTKEQIRDFRRRLLGFFDPEIPKLASEIDEANAKLKAPASEKVKPVPEAPRPVEVNPPETKPVPKPRQPLETPVKKIDAEDIRQAKSEGLQGRANWIRKKASAIAVTVGGYRMLNAISHGNFAALGPDFAEMAVGVGTTQALASVLENPTVRRLLTEPTARDIAQIPPEMRGPTLSRLLDEAKKQGIKVDPRISALAGASAVGPRTKELQSMRSQPSQ
jgi:hypothetical protein